MGVVEQNIALVTKDNKNNTVLQYPLTTLNQVEGLEESLNKCISKNPTVIPRDADLNTILETGYYCCADTNKAQTIKNCPLQVAFYLEVVKNQESNANGAYNQFKQIVTAYNFTSPRTFIRAIYNGNFGEWQEFVFSQNAIKSITANNNVLTYTTANAERQTVTIDNVPNATKAQKDSRKQVIDSTYIKGLSANGRTITVTKGDGTTSTITTQDTNTTYSPASSSVLGLVKTGTNITNNSGTISITKSNVVNALGYTPPTVNTTYNVATQTTNGLMSANDKKKLDTIKYQSGRNASMWR